MTIDITRVMRVSLVIVSRAAPIAAASLGLFLYIRQESNHGFRNELVITLH